MDDEPNEEETEENQGTFSASMLLLSYVHRELFLFSYTISYLYRTCPSKLY